jgi:hypothetical protein
MMVSNLGRADVGKVALTKLGLMYLLFASRAENPSRKRAAKDL